MAAINYARTRWTTNHFDRALPLLRAGQTVEQIAQALGTTYNIAYPRLRPYMKRRTTAGLGKH